MADEEEKAAGAKADKSNLIKYLVMGVILLVFMGVQVAMALYFVEKLKPEKTDTAGDFKPEENQQ